MIETEVGFIGGHVVGASYQQVCSGETGHAEAVHMKFDPSKVDYEQLLAIFWDHHDPTQTDGQGVNLGEQYRSVIFFHSQEQRKVAEKSRASLVVSGRYSRPITTGILEAKDFVRAEEYHQQYFEKQGLIRGG